MSHKAIFNRFGRQCRRGVSATEFAVIAPVLFLFVFAMFEFGRMVMIQQTMTNAARAGCRRAVLATTTDKTQVESTVKEHLGKSMSDTSDVTIAVNPSTLSGMASGTQVSVDVSVDYSDVSWVPSSILNPTISSRSVQQRE